VVRLEGAWGHPLSSGRGLEAGDVAAWGGGVGVSVTTADEGQMSADADTRVFIPIPNRVKNQYIRQVRLSGR
jgi:hypothetical protein